MNKYLLSNKKNGFYILLSAIFLSFNLAMTIHYLYHNGLPFGDFYIRWQECAYFLHGINPFDIMKGNVPPDTEIGAMLSGVGTLPWAYLLGNFINPGFLPYDIAEGYGIFLYIALPITTVFMLIRFIKSEFKMDDLFTRILISLSVFFPYKWLSAFSLGNQGGIVCCLIIISMCILNEFPMLSGILMGIAMVKPQISALFLFMILLNKKFKPFIAASVVVFISWVVSFVVTSTAPFEMLTQMFTQGTRYISFTYFGLFDFLKNYNIGAIPILILDMLSGLVFIIAYYIVCKEKKCLNILILFSGTAIASTFWFYKSTPDLVILIIPGILLLLIIGNINLTLFSSLATLIVCAILYLNLISSVLSRILLLILNGQRTTDYPFCMLSEKLLFMFIAFALVYCSAKTVFKEENKCSIAKS